jgi:hypothetical protein
MSLNKRLLVKMWQLYAMARQEVERPSQFKATTNNLESFLLQSNILKNRSRKSKVN